MRSITPPLLALFAASVLGLSLTASAHAETTQAVSQEISLSWANFGRVFRSRFHERAPDRVVSDKTHYQSLITAPLRLNPTIQGSWQEGTQKISATQTTPWGTSLSGSYSESNHAGATTTPQEKNYEASVRQELLKGGLWNGLAPVTLQSVSDEISDLKNDISSQTLLRDAINAFLDAQMQMLREKIAQKNLERAESETARIERDITQGYKAKTDLLIFQLALNNARLSLRLAQNARTQAMRKLEASLWQRPGDQPFVIEQSDPPEALTRKFDSFTWPSESAPLRIARLERQLASTKSDVASRDALPSLGIWRSWSKQEERYGLDFSFPLASVVRRETSKVANLDLIAAQSNLEQKILEDRQSRLSTEEEIAALRFRVEIANANVALAAKSAETEGQKVRDGRTTIQELRRAQDELTNAENAAVDARTTLFKRLVQATLDCGTLRSLMEVEL